MPLFNWKKNPLVERDIARSAELAVVLKAGADQGARRAQEMAPVESGRYRDGIKSDIALVDGIWVARVVGTDFKSHWIEFGTAKGFPAHATLRRGCEAAGLKVRGTR